VNTDRCTLLIARVGRERFAFDVAGIDEAADAVALESVPQLPAGAMGLLRWRGVAHTVWSPERALHVSVESPATVLFIRSGAGRVAVAVDDVEDLVTLPRSAIRALAGIDEGAGLVLGGIRVGNSFATVVDPGLLAGVLGGARALAPPGSAR